MTAITLIEPADTPVTAVAPTTPAQLLTIAVQRGADLAQLERLMDLQERFEKREAEKAYNEAFTAFKAEAVEVLKNKRVTDGPLKGKGYAELHAVVEAATPALSRHGLSASWRITKDDRDWLEVTCTLRHTLGHFEAVSMGGPPDAGGAKNAIQARASTVSYLERYTFKAICGLAEKDEDTDGGRGQAANDDDQPLIDAGQAAAMEGMAALTAWWGSLDNKQRGRLSKPFAAMRRAAQQADGGARA
jgi:hypothetical protein